MSEYNESIIKCIDCSSCVDGRCMYANGAMIEDVNEEFVCLDFTPKSLP